MASRSQDLIDSMSVAIQAAVDAEALGTYFELKELFSDNDWQRQVVAAGLSKSVTVAFKRRINGWPNSSQPVFTNVQVGDVRQNGRERMFMRINGHHAVPVA